MINRTWYTIINPKSGNGKGGKDWPEIRKLLEFNNIIFEEHFTERPFHGIELASEALDMGFRHLLIVGGDGTMNEAVNAMMTHGTINKSKVCFGVIPIGTGNDWCRTQGIPHDYKKAVDIFVLRNKKQLDLGMAEFTETGQVRYFANIAGIGFDAEVVETVQQKRLKNGSVNIMSYLWNMMKNLIGTKVKPISLEWKNGKHDGPMLTGAVAIGKYNGGGMKQAPDAMSDDGLFDVTIVGKISKLKIIVSLPRLYSGSFVKMKEVNQFRMAQISLKSKETVLVETDGEQAGSAPVLFSILPAALNVMLPQ